MELLLFLMTFFAKIIFALLVLAGIIFFVLVLVVDVPTWNKTKEGDDES